VERKVSALGWEIRGVRGLLYQTEPGGEGVQPLPHTPTLGEPSPILSESYRTGKSTNHKWLPKSSYIPKGWCILAAHHAEMLLEKSGISEEVVRRRRYWTREKKVEGVLVPTLEFGRA
jgi:hypothetical protein